jgi:hypothetical protein
MDEKRLRMLEDHIAEALREAQAKGELQGARSYGKPLDLGDGYDDTPPELRMAFKILKDSGFAPAEVQLLNDLAELRKQLAALDAASPEAQELRGKIHDLELKISLRMERLARHGV